MSFPELVSKELASARAHHRPMNSLHEAYAVLLEEIEELWAEIKCRPELRSKARILKEATQVAAMVQRMVEDCNLIPN